MRTMMMAGAVGVALAGGAAHAQFNPFSSRGTWQAAAGASSFTENFEGFAGDTSFRTSPVALAGGMSIQQVGPGTFRNEVDVVPLVFPGEGATSNIGSLFTNADGVTEVRINFGTGLTAFGFDHYGASGGEGVRMTAFNGATALGSIVLTGGARDFTGFTLASGFATSVLFQSISTTPGSGGEGFAIDEVSGVFVPAPGAAALLGLAGLVGLRRRR